MKITKEIDHVRNVTSSIAYHYLELGHECSSFSIDSFASSLFVRLYEPVYSRTWKEILSRADA